MSFTIKELEALSGIKAHTIRIWEQRYSFLKPSRTQTNIRTYSNDELKTILTVALLNKHGYKISKIDNMKPEQRRHEVLQMKETDVQNEQVVNDLVGAMVDIDFLHFEKILSAYIHKHSIEETVSTVIFSFLQKVGVLWQTNRIVPAQEHVATNIIRQKLVAAIDAMPAATNSDKPYLLFLPEDEHHELGLLFVYYLMRKNRLPVLYLGANLPLKDVAYVTEVKAIENLYVHLTAFPSKQSISKYLSALSEKCPAAKIHVSGYAIEGYKKSPGPNVHLLKSLPEVITYISSLS